MRKVTALIMLVICLSMGLAGCSESGYTLNDLSIKNSAGKVLSYGMSREDAEKILGEPMRSFSTLVYYDCISVIYRDDKIAMLHFEDDIDKESDWQTSKGIVIGSKLEDFLKKYNLKKHEYIDSISETITYNVLLVDNNNKFEQIAEPLDAITNEEEFEAYKAERKPVQYDYSIYVIVEDGIITGVFLGDYQAATSFS